MDRLLAVGEALLGITAVVLVGRYGLNPFFRILARSGAREVMTSRGFCWPNPTSVTSWRRISSPSAACCWVSSS
jgi:hypothetical protein